MLRKDIDNLRAALGSRDPSLAFVPALAPSGVGFNAYYKTEEEYLNAVGEALRSEYLSPGITSGFRDDYRQSLASGNKAATDSSYHGGSRRGGYGHGLAVDLVSVRGETRPERWISSDKLWNWIDAHGREYGIGRPYLDKDAPHAAPIDGKEYPDHRVGAHEQLAGLEARRYHRSSAQHDRKMTKRARAERLSRARST